MRKFDDFNDRHGKNNPHVHNDVEIFDETDGDKVTKFGKDIEKSEDTRPKYDNRFVIIDTDGKVLSEINEEINYFDTIDMEDGGYAVAIKFEDEKSAEDFKADELEKFPELELEVIPVKDAFAFLYESNKRVKSSAKAQWKIINDTSVLGWEPINQPVLALDDAENNVVIGIFKDKATGKYNVQVDTEETSIPVEFRNKPTARSLKKDFELKEILKDIDIPEIPESMFIDLEEAPTIETVLKGKELMTFPEFYPEEKKFEMYVDIEEEPNLSFHALGHFEGDDYILEITPDNKDAFVATEMSLTDFNKLISGNANNEFLSSVLERFKKNPMVGYFMGLDVSGMDDEPIVEENFDNGILSSIELHDNATANNLKVELYKNDEDDLAITTYLVDERDNNEFEVITFDDVDEAVEYIDNFLDLRDPYNAKFVIKKLVRAIR